MYKIKLPNLTPAKKAEMMIAKHGQEDAEKNAEQLVFLSSTTEDSIYEYWSKVLTFVKSFRKLKTESGI